MIGSRESGAGVVGRRDRVPLATANLAIYASALFVSGLFILAAAGTRYETAVYAWIALLAAAVAVPVVAAGYLMAGVERVTGRAWLSGARRLRPDERGWRATAARGVRYASWVWFANGAALWVATVLSQFGA